MYCSKRRNNRRRARACRRLTASWRHRHQHRRLFIPGLVADDCLQCCGVFSSGCVRLAPDAGTVAEAPVQIVVPMRSPRSSCAPRGAELSKQAPGSVAEPAERSQSVPQPDTNTRKPLAGAVRD